MVTEGQLSFNMAVLCFLYKAYAVPSTKPKRSFQAEASGDFDIPATAFWLFYFLQSVMFIYAICLSSEESEFFLVLCVTSAS